MSLQLRYQYPATARQRRAVIKCFAGGAAVKFVLPYHCRYGQSVCLIGSIDKLGKWDVSRAVEMSWHDGDLWKVELELPKSGPDTTEEVEYKYVVRNSDRSAAHWAPGANYVLTLPPVGPVAQPGTVRLYVRDSWDGQEHKVKVHFPGDRVEEEERSPSASQPAVAAAAAVAEPPRIAEPRPAAAAAATVAQPELRPPPQPQPAPRVPQPEVQPSPKRRGRPRSKPLAPAPAPAAAVDDEGDAVMAAITKESERAMEKLDEAISSSWELLEGSEDPADPDLLAADRLLAAASQRAAAMAKALDAAKAQRLLGDGSSSGGKEGKGGRRGGK